MDDFIALAQHPHLPSTLHHTLQSIFQIFRDQSTPKDPPQRRHIISTSKIEKGDATWSPQKVVLGWLINAAEGTLRLQPHKADRLKDITEAFTRKSRTSRKQWMRLLGELRYMATAIPGARYLFSVLQHVLKDQPKSTRVRLNPLVKQSLRDWGLLARSLHANPMPIAALVPRAPHYLGAVDASRTGCGGFWIASSVGNLKQPTAFRLLFNQNIQQDLVSSANPTGSITNSDLELASLVLGAAVLQDIAPTAQACAFSASDNTPAVSWARKGSTTSIGANAHLLRWLASLTRASNLTLHPVSVPGSTNTIADFLSRSFYLDDQALLAELNKRFPTQPSWQLAHPTFSHKHELISALSRKPFQWHSATHAKEETARQQQRGKPSVTALTSIPPWPTAPTPFHHSNYLPIDTEQEKLLPAALKCAARQWETPFVPWDRRSPSWASKPRLTTSGTLDIRLSRLLSAYTKQDSPPTRVKPIPISVLQNAVFSHRQRRAPHNYAIADMITLGFFFLLRPGEYAATTNPESSPFRLCDVHLFRGNTRLTFAQVTDGPMPTFAALEFTNQKNGVRGELIGLGPSGDAAFCPVHAIRSRVLHLIQHRAPPTTPLFTYYDYNLPLQVTSAHLTGAIRVAVQVIGHQVGLNPTDVSVRSLRASGAMALLCANVDTDRIRLLGRWRSDEMLRYLHVQAVPLVAPIASAMLRHGQFHLLPNTPIHAP